MSAAPFCLELWEAFVEYIMEGGAEGPAAAVLGAGSGGSINVDVAEIRRWVASAVWMISFLGLAFRAGIFRIIRW